MLRTEPAALSLPGPSGSGFPSQAVATSTAGLLRPFRSRRPCRAVSCAFRTPAVRLPGCKAQRRFACRAPTLRRVPAHFHFRCRITRFSPCRQGLIQPQPVALTVQGVMNSPQNFLPESGQKLLCSAPDRCAMPWPVCPLRRRFSNG